MNEDKRHDNAKYVLGVDGGATQTHAVIADSLGKIVGVGESGSSNDQVVCENIAQNCLERAVINALNNAGLLDRDAPSESVGQFVDAACFGLSTVDTPNFVSRWSRWISKHFSLNRLSVVLDVELVLAACSKDPCIALVIGTGSMIIGRDELGRLSRVGGWGHILGDEGGAYWIAIQALRHLVRTADGRDVADSLDDDILRYWGHSSAIELIEGIYSPLNTPNVMAQLAKVVCFSAEDGNRRALSIIDRGVKELIDAIEHLTSRLEVDKPRVAVSGSMIMKQRVFRQRFMEAANERLESVTYINTPVEGAVSIALDMLNNIDNPAVNCESRDDRALNTPGHKSIQKFNRVAAVLFDFDGVLLDSMEFWFELVNAAAKEFGHDPVNKSDFINHFGQSTEEDIKTFFPDYSVDELNRYFIENFEKYLDKCKLMPSSRLVLGTLETQGYAIALVTNMQRAIVERLLNRFFLSFQSVVTASDVTCPKPAPDMILQACKDLSVNKENAVTVGDSRFDRDASQAAGVRFIGYGINGDISITNLAQLPILLS